MCRMYAKVLYRACNVRSSGKNIDTFSIKRLRKLYGKFFSRNELVFTYIACNVINRCHGYNVHNR